ncbi:MULTISPECIES: hypothetical protein [unclassified Methylobacterium]|uniref:hypothetical protein n=1 Tax=unclassified Methylobacterium TaxID=2615210 RepID=UPI0006F78F8D|nr:MULTISPECIES: hypothetical protein [unclassified Methylobacterium]KQP15481.1 hypothetical protein ASF26_17335 [Methylobacterium sp. Leaf93]TXN31775.1 hypothetical protein FV225_19830 [Methylobacterium sp. WL93]TXN44454.1 hypothetical protein FV227_26620 [Methylobacterium sp. WL119]TXN62526.1 hypothetical protein FV232_25275 [Methylobacterium sp. WL30]
MKAVIPAIEAVLAASPSRDEDATVYAMFGALGTIDAEGRAAAKRAFPEHPAVAAILTFDFCTSDDHATVAAALEPHAAAAPTLRQSTEDDEWTAAERAVYAARTFVGEVARMTGHGRAGHDRWEAREHLIATLRNLQVRHLEEVACDLIGQFPGYDVRGQGWWAWGAPGGMSIQVRVGGRPILSLPGDVTRREVEMAILGWKAGNDQGLHEGAERIRRGIKNLLEVEAA